jgi:hypothetical protein
MTLRSRIEGVMGRTRRARIITAATVVALVGAVIAFIAIDPGGDSSDGSSSENPYQASADNICVNAKNTLFGIGHQLFTPPQPPDALPKYLSASAQIARQTRSYLAALNPPDDLRERAKAFDARLAALASTTDAAAAAVRSADPNRIQAAGPRVEQATAGSDRAAAALGLERCPRIQVRLRPTAP